MSSRTLTPSSKATPCVICGRNEDGDCRISDDLILCRVGTRHHPPTDLKGAAITGRDGQRWICRGPAADPSWIQFTPETTATNRHAHQPITPGSARIEPQPAMAAAGQSKPAPITKQITLARLPQPTEAPPDHLPDGFVMHYSDTQRVVCSRKDGNKGFPVSHLQDGKWIKGAGPDPWPLWHQAEALQHGPGHWIAEAEGEKCTDWLRAGGLVAISQPGHNHTVEAITPRYQALHQAGIKGVLYLADHDEQGRKKASRVQQAAKAAGLQFLLVPADLVWNNLPSTGGSIDDAPGTAADRVAQLISAIPDAIEQQQGAP